MLLHEKSGEDSNTHLESSDFNELENFKEVPLKEFIGSPAHNPRSRRINLDSNPLLLARKFEGDMVTPTALRRRVRQDINPDAERYDIVSSGDSILWPDAEIPYLISKRYGSYARKMIAKAFDEFHRKTCIRFVPRTDQENYIVIVPDEGCYSSVGMQGGEQTLSLTEECFGAVGVVIHELMHSVGFVHEQTRPDRDDWVEIVWDNIIEGQEEQFQKYPTGYVQTLGTGYDYASVMHYGPYDFSVHPKRAKTIIAKQPGGAVMGQRKGLSKIDVYEINKLYCGSRK